MRELYQEVMRLLGRQSRYAIDEIAICSDGKV